MKITIMGTGYVGLVTGACLADVGHQVFCFDINREKIQQLLQGQVPFFEPGLAQIIKRNVSQRLFFSDDFLQSLNYADVIFIAVGTPPNGDGSADLQYVLGLAEQIGSHITDSKIIVTKSTVPVGTAEKVKQVVDQQLEVRGLTVNVEVVANPEFLKEGAAVADFMRPDRIVVGVESESTKQVMSEIYAPFNRNHNRMMFMEVKAAELTKYAANAMLATKISFMNDMANLAERLGVDIEQVRLGIGSDHRIGYHFIYPGCGYGGSCFPKDVKAITQTARQAGSPLTLLETVDQVNQKQKQALFNKLNQYFAGELSGKVIAVWGLAFKPKTDDMREAPSRQLMEQLWQVGATVKAFDPEAMAQARLIYEGSLKLTLVDNPYDALVEADALVICTEWAVFRAPDFEQMRQLLRQPVIFDGRNIYDPHAMACLGFHYYAIGRGKSALNG
ncbi:UDP-glucose/GDP-mannose dehydrogenase family protein [Endozoicomonas sp. SM1973]|uniref:UDP-glucose 6-dehydrogenase n=1 Tax=Spartinivicinus marinus TaxID=2994442 RepID=A0A853I004_9GAMM|nr:UDP-glucose/GDP-mannose dehydrogenase family protein [Spartinivicinus marinus]MCX4025219.1 UDP-glucose/GDP-mannose dehydrogenase family protein [Spartinivicinus marinus]NYZ65939.1 UDP-glucose/GDP-mannose dehydrogenase family protein [Spartinivicinus marinus]